MQGLADIFHHGLLVDDLEAAMADIGRTGAIDWAPIRSFDPLPVWDADGTRIEARLRVAYARQGPLRMELVEAAPGSPYDLMRSIDRSHIGVWVEDVAGAVADLEALGWRLLMAGASPRRGHGSMAYLAREGSPVIEVVSRALMPVMEAWWQEQATG